MNKIFEKQKIGQFKLLCDSADRITIISHTNPDGDAVGSGLALLLFLRGLGYTVRFFVPNHFPDFLKFIDPERDIEIFSENCGEVQAALAASDLIICVDFNQINRLERMTAALEMNLHAPRVLIDHHIAPPDFDLTFWSTESSSTAFMIYNLILQWTESELLTLPIANALYLGMMTDTGGFSFGNLTPELYRAVSVLVACGVDAPAVNRAVFNTQSESRLRMVGYLISEKMVVQGKSAYITLNQDEKLRFNHQIGDTEGIVNIPMTIADVRFSIFMMETMDCIKLSLRSIGDLDVNLIARNSFNGGGHRNAAGGKFYGTMDQAIEFTEKIISEIDG